MVFNDSVELVSGFSLIVFAAYQACGFLRVIFFYHFYFCMKTLYFMPPKELWEACPSVQPSHFLSGAYPLYSLR